MKPAPFEYHAPESLSDVTALLAEHGDEAKVLAGGQSLVPMLALRLTRFEHIVDLNRVDELRELVTLAIVDRHDASVPDPEGWRVVRVSVPQLQLSSTDLRRRVAAGEPIDFLVPMPAVRVLRAHGLYADS